MFGRQYYVRIRVGCVVHGHITKTLSSCVIVPAGITITRIHFQIQHLTFLATFVHLKKSFKPAKKRLAEMEEIWSDFHSLSTATFMCNFLFLLYYHVYLAPKKALQH